MNSHSVATVFRDTIMLALLVYLVVIILLVLHVRPPTEETPGDAPPGNLIVQIDWEPGIDADVDLWVQAPGDVPVGYSNKGGRIFNLLRDDLGLRHDTGTTNYEFSYSRGLPAGEYTVNLHLYGNWLGVLPIPVRVEIRRSATQGGTPKLVLLFSTSVNLDFVGEEITVKRFTLDDKGRVVPGSDHDIFKPLRDRVGRP